LRSRYPIGWHPTDKAPQEAFGGISNRRDKVSRGIRQQYKNSVSAKIASLIANEGMEWAVVVNRGRQDITPPEPARWGL